MKTDKLTDKPAFQLPLRLVLAALLLLAAALPLLAATNDCRSHLRDAAGCVRFLAKLPRKT